VVYTTHDLINAGYAALAAYAGRSDPATLTPDDLERVARLLERLYTTPGAMQAFIRGSVFHNAGYWMDAKRDDYVRRVLYGWREGALTLPQTQCAFCGAPAAYRASRQEIPLLNGAGTYNFGAAGVAGVPVCGRCSLAAQMLPLGCVRCGGALLAVGSDDPALVFALTREAFRSVYKAVTMGSAPPVLAYERTQLVKMLRKWLASAERRTAAGGRAPSLTGYSFTNAGATPNVRIYILSSNVVDFLERAGHNADGTLTDAWERAARRARVVPRKPGPRPSLWQNALYEALFDLPEKANFILRRYLFPTRHWGLVALFLRKVMDMQPERLELLRGLGERLAEYARERNGFYYAFSRTDVYAKWRRLLLRASEDYARAAGKPLITFEEFTQAFTAPPGEINDWRLARDLITLVLMERRVPGSDDLPDEAPDDEYLDDDENEEE
jgi:CRISPR-associated protein Cas8b1/Cst1 subtype I-B